MTEPARTNRTSKTAADYAPTSRRFYQHPEVLSGNCRRFCHPLPRRSGQHSSFRQFCRPGTARPHATCTPEPAQAVAQVTALALGLDRLIREAGDQRPTLEPVPLTVLARRGLRTAETATPKEGKPKCRQ